MEKIEVTSISSRGQVVIPQVIREQLNIHEGEKFVVIGQDDTIVLKKLEMPSKEKLIKDLENIAKEGRKRAEKLGIKERDVPGIIEKLRKEKKK